MSDQSQQAPPEPTAGEFAFRLYITGAAHHSTEAVENIKTFCEHYVRGRYSLDIIDVYQQPAMAKSQQIIAAPTLIVSVQGVDRRIIGNLSDTYKILSILGLSKVTKA